MKTFQRVFGAIAVLITLSGTAGFGTIVNVTCGVGDFGVPCPAVSSNSNGVTYYTDICKAYASCTEPKELQVAAAARVTNCQSEPSAEVYAHAEKIDNDTAEGFSYVAWGIHYDIQIWAQVLDHCSGGDEMYGTWTDTNCQHQGNAHVYAA